MAKERPGKSESSKLSSMPHFRNISPTLVISTLKTPTMAPNISRKRKIVDGLNDKVKRRKKPVKKQNVYHSSSSEAESETSDVDFQAVNLQDSDTETEPLKTGKAVDEDDQSSSPASESEEDVTSGSSDEEDQEDDEAGERAIKGDPSKSRHISKRNDPEAFSTSISKILSTKLSRSARKDPVLSRSKEAAEVTSGIAGERLEKRARAKLRTDKKEDLERGRVKDVLGLSTGKAGETAEEETRLRKIAQRGVIKLFNAVRAAQVRGEEAAKEERRKGTIGIGNREDKVNEVSKQGFLELINGKKKGKLIEEA